MFINVLSYKRIGLKMKCYKKIYALISALLITTFLMGSGGAAGCECHDRARCLELTACDDENSFGLDSNAHSGESDCCSATECVNSAPQYSHNHHHFYNTLRVINNPPLITSTLFSLPKTTRAFSSFQDTPIPQANCFLYSSKTTSLLI